MLGDARCPAFRTPWNRTTGIRRGLMSKIDKVIRLFQTESPSVALGYCSSYFGFRLLGRRLLSIEDICYKKWRL